MKWRLILGFLMFIFSSPVQAKNDMIAVLEAHGLGVDKNLLSLISDEIRSGTLKSLDKSAAAALAAGGTRLRTGSVAAAAARLGRPRPRRGRTSRGCPRHSAPRARAQSS